MPLAVDQLQLWTIGFKWAGLDPNRRWIRIPTPVRDNFSTLLHAILHGHLECMTLAMEKYHGDDREIAKFHIRFWLEDVDAGVFGQSYSRKLLKHAVIDRESFKDWCERCTIPLPEFWFPPGWTDYRWPEQDFEPVPTDRAMHPSERQPAGITPQQASSPPAMSQPEADELAASKLRAPQLAKIICKQIASVVWKDDPSMTIADMCKQELILKYGGGQYYSDEVVRRWVKEAAPAEVSAKPGRPKKKNPTEDE